jgi:hypothetical protein
MIENSQSAGSIISSIGEISILRNSAGKTEPRQRKVQFYYSHRNIIVCSMRVSPGTIHSNSL